MVAPYKNALMLLRRSVNMSTMLCQPPISNNNLVYMKSCWHWQCEQSSLINCRTLVRGFSRKMSPDMEEVANISEVPRSTLSQLSQKRVKEFQVYRWNPENPSKPYMQSFQIDISECGPMVSLSSF